MLAKTRAALVALPLLALAISPAYAAPTDLDDGFSGDGVMTLHSATHSEILLDLQVLPSGKTVVVTATLAGKALELWRLRKDGRPDPSFGGDGSRQFAGSDNYEDVHLAVDPWTGKTYVSAFIDGEPFTTTIWRFKRDGSLDSAYGGGDARITHDQRLVEDLLPLPGGRLLASGEDIQKLDADVWAFRSNGKPDRDYGNDGTARLSNLKTSDATSLVRRTDGKVVVAGSDYDPTATVVTAYRLTKRGHLDDSFSGDGKATIDPSEPGVTTSTAWTPQVLIRPDNRTVYVAGLNSNGSGGFQNTLLVAGLSPKGKPDHVFGKHVYDDITETWGQAALQRNGRLVVSGSIPPNPPSADAIYRFTATGALDHTWNGTGVIDLTADSDTIGLGITPKGRVIVGYTLGSGPYDAQLIALRGTRTPSCHGRLATQYGGKKGDTLIGTPGKDVLVGLGGKDVLKGRGGDDVLCGNAGNDTLVGGPGHDALIGGPGTDVIKP